MKYTFPEIDLYGLDKEKTLAVLKLAQGLLESRKKEYVCLAVKKAGKKLGDEDLGWALEGRVEDAVVAHDVEETQEFKESFEGTVPTKLDKLQYRVAWVQHMQLELKK